VSIKNRCAFTRRHTLNQNHQADGYGGWCLESRWGGR